MNKNNLYRSGSMSQVKKVYLVMKLSFVLLFAFTMQVSAHVEGQANVTVRVNQIEILKVLKAIETQADYHFLYNNSLKSLSHKIDVDMENVSVKDALDKIFLGTDLTYKMLDNNLIVILSNSNAPQDIKVTGKVTGENGEPLSGVSISVKGTPKGTATNNNGDFTITAGENATLVVSYIGYLSQEVPVNGQAIVNIKLLVSGKALDQVVVVGYGSYAPKTVFKEKRRFHM